MRNCYCLVALAAVCGCLSVEVNSKAPYPAIPETTAQFLAKGRHFARRKGMEARALEYFRLAYIAADDNTEKAKAYCAMGDLYFYLVRDKEAASAYSTALEYEPNNADAGTMLGAALLNLDHHEAAVRQLSVVVSKCPHAGKAYAWRGLAHHRRKRWDEAIADYQQAMILGLPRELQVRLYAGLADCYMKTGKFKLAIDTWQDMIRFEPGTDTAEVRKYMDLARTAQKEKAGS